MAAVKETPSIVLVTGASGLLGRAIYQHFKQFDQDYQVNGTCFSRHMKDLIQVDLTNVQETKELIERLKPKVLIHCAAERRPDVAEKNPDHVLKLNIESTKHLAVLCKEIDIFMIYISTDYVFDGHHPPYEVDDQPNPLNFYGVSKYKGELACQEVNSSVCILRVPVLYGEVLYNSESAVNILVDIVKNNTKPAKMDHFQVRYPTNVQDVAKVCRQLYEYFSSSDVKDVKGIFHYSAKERMTKYDMCSILAEILGTSIDHIEPVTSPSKESLVNRPINAQLSTSRLEKLQIDISHVLFKDWFQSYLRS